MRGNVNSAMKTGMINARDVGKIFVHGILSPTKMSVGRRCRTSPDFESMLESLRERSFSKENSDKG